MTKTVTEFARELGDREAIRDCLSRYGRAIDRADHALPSDIFWPDASIEFEGLINGPISEHIEKIVPETAQAMEQTAHFLGNMLIEIDGDYAITESYVHAFHRLPNDRVGGGIAPAALPHHRAYGSVPRRFMLND